MKAYDKTAAVVAGWKVRMKLKQAKNEFEDIIREI
jgi:hypothetical protein